MDCDRRISRCQDVAFKHFCSPVWNPCLNKLENWTLVFFCCTFLFFFLRIKGIVVATFFIVPFYSLIQVSLQTINQKAAIEWNNLNAVTSAIQRNSILWTKLEKLHFHILVNSLLNDSTWNYIWYKSIIKYFRYKIYNKKLKWSLPTRIFLKLSIWLIRVVIDFVKYFLQLCISVTVIYNKSVGKLIYYSLNSYNIFRML